MPNLCRTAKECAQEGPLVVVLALVVGVVVDTYHFLGYQNMTVYGPHSDGPCIHMGLRKPFTLMVHSWGQAR